MRKIPLSDVGLFVTPDTHGFLSTGWNPAKHAYPTQVAVRPVSDGEILALQPALGAVVKAWRWSIAAVGVHTLLVTENADGAKIASADFLTVAPALMTDIDDALAWNLSVGQIRHADAMERRCDAMSVLTDTARCLMWSYLRRNCDNITGHVWDWQEYQTDAIITCPRHALPIGITGGTTDLRKPYPIVTF